MKRIIYELPGTNMNQSGKFKKIERNEKAAILERLKELRNDSSSCYAISENRKLDARILETTYALDETIGNGMATILVFGDAETVFYEDEGPSERFISR